MRNAQSGRRRGRGNPRPPQGGGHNDRGNRVEPRQRGNAIQLLEKYSNLARDAHQQGDRVQAETYLQYADHYHRVVAEMRARQEERQPQQQQGERRDRGRDDREQSNQGARYERDDDDRDEDDGADDEGVNDNNAAAQRVETLRHDRGGDSEDRDDDSDDEGALRTLARSARVPDGNDDDSDSSAHETRADDGGASDRPRRRGRPRRSPREPVEA